MADIKYVVNIEVGPNFDKMRRAIEFLKDGIDRLSVVPAGTRCEKCSEDYPHATPRAGFVCWACTNGY